MISSTAKHPNCMYMWMNFIVSPKANAEVASILGGGAGAEPRSRPRPRTRTSPPNIVDNPAFWKRVFITGETPLAECGNGEDDCMDYND